MVKLNLGQLVAAAMRGDQSKMTVAGGAVNWAYITEHYGPRISEAVSTYMNDLERQGVQLPGVIDVEDDLVGGSVKIVDQDGVVTDVALSAPPPPPSQEAMERASVVALQEQLDEVMRQRDELLSVQMGTARLRIAARRASKIAPDPPYYGVTFSHEHAPPTRRLPETLVTGGHGESAFGFGHIPTGRVRYPLSLPSPPPYEWGPTSWNSWNIDRKLGEVTGGVPGWERAILFRSAVWPFIKAIMALIGLILVIVGGIAWIAIVVAFRFAWIVIGLAAAILTLGIFRPSLGHGHGHRHHRYRSRHVHWP